MEAVKKEKKDAKEIKSKILNVMGIRGPLLPIHIARETGMDMIFSSAFLSELAGDKAVKISNLKVGGSPLYYLPGQEAMLDNFYLSLASKEKEAFSILKEKKVLKDKELEPAIRVALRNIKDFAFTVFLTENDEKETYWYFHTLKEEEVREILEGSEKKEKKQDKQEEKIEEVIKEKPIEKIEKKTEITEVKTEVLEEKKPELKKHKEKQEKIIKTEEIKEKPLLEITNELSKDEKLKEKLLKQQEKIKQESDFIKELISKLAEEDIEIVEEKDVKKKEHTSIVRINSAVGKISFLCFAKDKKKISENDLVIALHKSQELKMPALIIARGELDKKAQEYIKSYSELIKFKKLD